MKINGKVYSLWQQFIDKKKNWIGSILEDFGDNIDKSIFGVEKMKTTITDITLKPIGTDSAYFSVEGKEFSCGGDIRYLGLIGGEEGYMTFSGFGGHTWRIKNRGRDEVAQETP